MRGLSPVAASEGHSSSRCVGLSLSRPLLLGAQAPDAQAQQLWLTGLVAPQHVGSFQTRARICVPCIGRQMLNHCATREAGLWGFLFYFVTVSLLPLPCSPRPINSFLFHRVCFYVQCITAFLFLSKDRHIKIL